MEVAGGASRLNGRSPPVPAAITHGIAATPHEAVYKTHKYFARRPGNVFNYLISHYSYPGDIVLDPFCGGGVTIFEALREGRKAIGIDFNPMAIFITEAEIQHVDLGELEREFLNLSHDLKARIEDMYMTHCDRCGRETPAEWYEWSNVLSCPKCGKEQLISDLTKVSEGRYHCKECGATIDQRKQYRIREDLIRVNYTCVACKRKNTRAPTDGDQAKAREISTAFDDVVRRERLEFPKDRLPDGNLVRENALFEKGFRHFSDFYTHRNLLAAAFVIKRIREVRDIKIRRILTFTFTSSLKWAAPRLCHRRDSIVEGWATHDFRVFPVFLEINFWRTFERRFAAVYRGKQYSNQALGDPGPPAESFDELKGDRRFLLLAQSSRSLPQIPDYGADVIITDPPYGSNVQYAELSDFWAVWIKPELGIESLIDNREEASSDRHFDFEGAKDLTHYQNLLNAILKECWKKLKPNGWLVMTFHNKELAVWNSLLMAAHDAGFRLADPNGVIYQPPIGAYTTTSHQRRGGSMLGDFILSFRRVESPPPRTLVEEREIEKEIILEVKKVIRYHGGAGIGTIYLQLIPYLTNAGLLHRVAQKDLEPILSRHFAKYGSRWYLREQLDERGNLKPFDFIPAERRIEELIRSILARKRRATLDEIYAGLYTNLVNGMTPEVEEIEGVLNRVARKVRAPGSRRDLWELKTQTTLRQFDIGIPEPEVAREHNEVVLKLVKIGHRQGFDAHVGEREQSQNQTLRNLSVPMGDNVAFGILPEAWPIIKQIDVLWLKGKAIVAAFEVEKSTTIDSGINRFRNLFAAQPNANVRAFIVVPDDRLEEARRKVSSPANVNNGLSMRIEVLTFRALSRPPHLGGT